MLFFTHLARSCKNLPKKLAYLSEGVENECQSRTLQVRYSSYVSQVMVCHYVELIGQIIQVAPIGKVIITYY